MPQILKRPAAEHDLEEIWWYIAQDSLHHADLFLDRIQESCKRLAEFPEIGNHRDELKAGLRSHPLGNYVIYYFPLADGIDVVRVLHASRDRANFLS